MYTTAYTAFSDNFVFMNLVWLSMDVQRGGTDSRAEGTNGTSQTDAIADETNGGE
eukprot:COSAG02_NODE_3850_length_6147_cov_7.419478_5_plen_55_part_00